MEPLSDDHGLERGTPLDRRYIETFLARREDVFPGEVRTALICDEASVDEPVSADDHERSWRVPSAVDAGRQRSRYRFAATCRGAKHARRDTFAPEMTAERVEGETVRRFAPLVCATSVRMIQVSPYRLRRAVRAIVALDHGGVRRTVGDMPRTAAPPMKLCC